MRMDPVSEVLLHLVDCGFLVSVNPERILRRECIETFEPQSEIGFDSIRKYGIDRWNPIPSRPLHGSLVVPVQPLARNHHLTERRSKPLPHSKPTSSTLFARARARTWLHGFPYLIAFPPSSRPPAPPAP